MADEYGEWEEEDEDDAGDEDYVQDEEDAEEGEGGHAREELSPFISREREQLLSASTPPRENNKGGRPRKRHRGAAAVLDDNKQICPVCLEDIGGPLLRGVATFWQGSGKGTRACRHAACWECAVAYFERGSASCAAGAIRTGPRPRAPVVPVRQPFLSRTLSRTYNLHTQVRGAASVSTSSAATWGS